MLGMSHEQDGMRMQGHGGYLSGQHPGNSSALVRPHVHPQPSKVALQLGLPARQPHGRVYAGSILAILCTTHKMYPTSA